MQGPEGHVGALGDLLERQRPRSGLFEELEGGAQDGVVEVDDRIRLADHDRRERTVGQLQVCQARDLVEDGTDDSFFTSDQACVRARPQTTGGKFCHPQPRIASGWGQRQRVAALS